MPFQVSARTLERLEWPLLVARLRSHARTPRARARCRADAGEESAPGPLFAADREGARTLLAETVEAHALLARGAAAPTGGLDELDGTLGRLARGGVLSAPELQQLGSALATLHAVRHFALRHVEEAPRLAAWAGEIAELRDLESEIAFTFDAEGEVRDAASSLLAESRASVRQLTGELQRRLHGLLHDPEIAPNLSDEFVTTRNDRWVLPVRADARGRVPGIVHDASGSGATLFVEPQAVVDLNNRLRRAELEVSRETLRILRELSTRAAAAAPAVEHGLDATTAIDLAFARAGLARELDAVAPEVGDEGRFVLPLLRHPLLPPAQAVPNDVALGDEVRVLVLSGPNAGGKTILMKAVALAALCVRAGLFVTAAPGARVDLVDALLADIGDEQDLRESHSTFSAHVANLSRILGAASPRTLVVLDEVGQGTDPSEGAALAQALLEALADAGARVVATTHFNLLKEMAGVDPRFENASFEFDPTTLAPTYRLRPGVAGASSAMAVAARMGMPAGVLERADALLSREDRRLDGLLAELAASRVSLETEQREAARLRAESEAARSEYRTRLQQLQTRRDELYRRMRQDLDHAFRDAHAQVAAVIRDLQRGGGARDAAHARSRLERLAESTEAAARAAGVVPAAEEKEDALPPVDWRFARPGDAVRIRGGGEAVLETLPDRRGRVAVRSGAARLQLPAAQLAATGAPAPSAAGRSDGARARTGGARTGGSAKHGDVSVEATAPEPAPVLRAVGPRCDLRGLRVEEALGALESALDRAATAGEDSLVVIHGLGTGALRDAVRRALRGLPYVARFGPAEIEDGGDGVTLVALR